MIPICSCVVAITTMVVAKGGSGGGGLGAGDKIALIAVIVSVIGLAVTIGVAVFNVVKQQQENRRQERAHAYAEAIRAVDDYLETPYRIWRRNGSGEHRWQLTESISEIQSRINFHQGWLRINASKAVYDAYVKFIKTAKTEAGAQMTTAWNGPVTKKDGQVPLGAGLPQPESEAAKELLVEAMKDCLKP